MNSPSHISGDSCAWILMVLQIQLPTLLISWVLKGATEVRLMSSSWACENTDPCDPWSTLLTFMSSLSVRNCGLHRIVPFLLRTSQLPSESPGSRCMVTSWVNSDFIQLQVNHVGLPGAEPLKESYHVCSLWCGARN